MQIITLFPIKIHCSYGTVKILIVISSRPPKEHNMSMPSEKPIRERPHWILGVLLILSFLALAVVPWLGLESDPMGLVLKIGISVGAVLIGALFVYIIWFFSGEAKDLPWWAEPLGWILVILS